MKVITTVDLVLGLGLALLAGIRALRDRPPHPLDVGLAALAEIGVLVYIGVRVAGLVGGHHPSSTGLLIVYLLALALVLPVAVLLALAERTRWGSAVLAIGALTVCVLFARVAQIWSPHG